MTAENKRATYLPFAKFIVRIRDLRDTILGGGIFADPAWDMLLDLYITAFEGRELSVGDACVGSRVAPTTGMRWISELARRKLIEKVSDPADRRRVFVRLTAHQIALMDNFFETVSSLPESALGGQSWNCGSADPTAASNSAMAATCC